jgi:hypothetical protein
LFINLVSFSSIVVVVVVETRTIARDWYRKEEYDASIGLVLLARKENLIIYNIF